LEFRDQTLFERVELDCLSFQGEGKVRVNSIPAGIVPCGNRVVRFRILFRYNY
jgi:hypothetical protein